MAEVPKALRWEGSAVSGRLVLLDQRRLPLEELELICLSVGDVFEAIRTLAVRGAPLIGVAAAYGAVLGTEPPRVPLEARPQEVVRGLMEAAAWLETARPTAVNLHWALARMRARAESLVTECDSGEAVRTRLLAEAHAIREEDARMCAAIGRHGAALLPERARVLTHCNAGALATAGIGTALGVIYTAHAQGRIERVYADETRPLLQGARLTSWELMRAGVPVTLIADSMAASVLASGRVDVVITGADRIAGSGDVANKIGTYMLAVLARRHGVPFYVAAPSSTFDLSIARGEEIPIEERGPEELRTFAGVPSAPPGVEVFNPAFDVTPAELISAIITERGVIEPVEARTITAMVGGGEGA